MKRDGIGDVWVLPCHKCDSKPAATCSIADELTSVLRNSDFRDRLPTSQPGGICLQVFAEYASRYGAANKEAVLVGMNPGPWGMAQTGVPFGEVRMVRDWMKLEGTIGKLSRTQCLDLNVLEVK
jgi:hypothetical protein